MCVEASRSAANYRYIPARHRRTLLLMKSVFLFAKSLTVSEILTVPDCPYIECNINEQLMKERRSSSRQSKRLRVSIFHIEIVT